MHILRNFPHFDQTRANPPVPGSAARDPVVPRVGARGAGDAGAELAGRAAERHAAARGGGAAARAAAGRAGRRRARQVPRDHQPAARLLADL